MSTIRVRSHAQALGVIAQVRARLSDWRPFFDRVQEDLPKTQQRNWDRFPPHQSGGRTYSARLRALRGPASRANRQQRRRRGRDYYQRNQPNRRASPSTPRWEWTGSLRRATQRFTAVRKLRARIDAERNYDGPLRRLMSRPFDTTIGSSPEGRRIWDMRDMAKLTDRALRRFIERDVIGAVTRRGGRG